MTEAKQQIIAESEHPLHTYIIEAVVSGHSDVNLERSSLRRAPATVGEGRL